MCAVDTERQKKYIKATLSQALRELRMAQVGKIRLEDARDLFTMKHRVSKNDKV